MSNLIIYDKARAVPEEAKKTIQGGRLKGKTDINPMWRIKKLTELFGPCGIGWWYDIIDKHLAVDEISKQVAAFVDIMLYYIDPESGKESHGIPGTGGSTFVAKESKDNKVSFYMSDECYKMALTDAISVAAKALGIGADVYWEKDRNKYSNPPDTSPEGSFTPQCAECHKEISINEHEFSVKKYKRPLCRDCQKAADAAETAKMQFRCEQCGEVLKPYIGVDGKEVSIRKHAEGSRMRFNGALFCIDCIMKAQEAGRAIAAAQEGA